MITLELRFGTICDPLRDQIKAAGFRLKNLEAEEELLQLQLDTDAVSRLRFRGYMTPKQTDAARKRILRIATRIVELDIEPNQQRVTPA